MIADCFKLYMDYSDFIDSSSFVTARNVEDFKKLFIDNARVWNDYLWDPKLEYANVYADQVYYYHRIKGLKVEYDEDVLEQLSKINLEEMLKDIDDAEPNDITYKYEFNARKGVYYILNKENKVIYYNEPVEYDLNFIFHISTEDQMAKIADILPIDFQSKK
ncbi:hypothetical protein [Portibacter marinus]|uniref:hypothetical protein n=1 Tax=Portibacter marinus TaxID=2898660 RepID=UPI001F191239|nr:hypothetical protein [Portibacter marinus]